MRIQHNIAALNSYRQLSNNNNSVSKNLEKLSSGFRINRAGDDAAGLAISEKMRAQITGLETAQKNANDGISLVQTAEGALTEVHSMLNRMVELAGQSANGTYDNETDRANLQKEVQSLKDEINRISEGTNFNGINLLDGSVNEAYGINTSGLTSEEINAIKSGTIGTTDNAVNGVLSEKSDAVNYSAKFYIGEITNSNAAIKNLEFKFTDNKGASQTLTLKVDSGDTVSTEDIVNAMNGTSGTKVGSIDVTSTGDLLTGAAGNGGQFSELYNVTYEGNIITVTAKDDKSTSGLGVIDGDELGAVSFDPTCGGTPANGFDTADVEKAIQAIKEKYAGTGNAASIGYGTAAGEATEYKEGEAGSYQVASIKVALTGDGAANHNKGIKVGGQTYVIQHGENELKGVPDDAVIVKVDDADTSADAVAKKLAAAISANEQTNGNYVATNNNGTLTISESTNRAQNVLDKVEKAGLAESVASLIEFTTTPGTTETNGELTLDASQISNGSTITVGDKVYMLTKDASVKTPEGATAVVIDPDATDEEAAQALVDAMTQDGINGLGVTAGTGTITFTDSDTKGAVSADGAGLTLQIGDTAESFNQMSVKINSTSTNSLGIDGINISTQDGAKAAMDTIKDAINAVSSNRGDLGAIQNRLEHTINNLGVTSENMTAAESRIRDVDMAKEMMAYTKNNILVQASQAMLAQANQIPQGVLQLLQ